MRRFAQLAVLILLTAVGHLRAAETETERREQALSAIRAAAAGRDWAQVSEGVVAAKKLAGDAAYDKQLARLEELTNYVGQFWGHVETVLKGIDDVKELMVGDQLVAVIEYANETLILRVAGQNRSYTKKDMPAKLALTLAQQKLLPDNPINKVFFGAFLALDGKGDKKIARQYWEEAAQAKIDVARFLPELDVPQVPIATQVPAMNVFLKNVLSDKNWMLRRKTAKGWTKQANGEAVAQNDEGRLVVRAATSEQGPVQGVANRRILGDFLCRMIVTTTAKGSVVGLFAADADDASYTAPLPVGTFLVEIRRVQGKLAFKVGERDIEPTIAGDPGPRIPLVIGLAVPPGSEATIAAIEFPTR